MNDDPCTSDRPQGGEDGRRWSVLFNYIRFTERMELADHLWRQGWRRDVRPEDITEGK